MAMEPLAIRFCQEGKTWGIPLGTVLHAVSLYAEDLLLYLYNIHMDSSGKHAMLQAFMGAAGLRVNWAKSCA